MLRKLRVMSLTSMPIESSELISSLYLSLSLCSSIHEISLDISTATTTKATNNNRKISKLISVFSQRDWIYVDERNKRNFYESTSAFFFLQFFFCYSTHSRNSHSLTLISNSYMIFRVLDNNYWWVTTHVKCIWRRRKKNCTHTVEVKPYICICTIVSLREMN